MKPSTALPSHHIYQTQQPLLYLKCIKGGQQHRSITGDCSLTIPLHSQLRLAVKVRVLLSTEILRQLCRCGMHQWWTVDGFVAWCENSHLISNVNQTKEVSEDFRRTRSKLNITAIVGEAVEEHEYCDVQLDNRLDRWCNTDVVYEKRPSRLYDAFAWC